MSEGGGTLRAAGRLARIAGLAAGTLARAGRRGDRPGQERHRSALLSDVARRALEIHGLEVRASGRPPKGPALLVSNHLSYLDPLVFLSRAACVPISKSELASWPLFGAVARRTGVLFVERSSAGSRLAVMRAAERVFRDGGIVLNFPEGTTSDGSTVLRFRKGLFEVARALGVPVIPAALRYRPGQLAWIGEATFVPHYLRFASLARSTAEVLFGDPLPSPEHSTAERLADAARSCTSSLLEDRSAWLRTAR